MIVFIKKYRQLRGTWFRLGRTTMFGTRRNAFHVARMYARPWKMQDHNYRKGVR